MKVGKIAIIVGSKSDLETIQSGLELCNRYKIPHEVKILSAHRNLPELLDYIKSFPAKKIEVVIAIAGLAAHLAGVVASQTKVPVIGVPNEVGPLKGIDALLSMVQMPKSTPVAVMSIGERGVINAVLYALRILSLKYSQYQNILEKYQKDRGK